VMRCANERELAVIPQGHGAVTWIGNIPSRYDIALSLSRLSSIVEYEPADLTITCQAGATLDDLHSSLSDNGQIVPFARHATSSCVGRLLALPMKESNLAWGSARDSTIGMRVVTADGGITRAGGKVVKNVAGYDLGKLFCGSEGQFGLIARASLRLHPRPEAARTLVVPVASPEEAHEQAQAILRSTLQPSALDVHWPGRLALLFEGSARAVEAQAGAVAGGEEAGEEVWAEAAARQAQTGGRVSFAPGALARVLAEHEEAVVRVAAGVAYVSDTLPDPRGDALLALTERLRAAFDPHGVLD